MLNIKGNILLRNNPDIPSNKITLKKATAKPKLLDQIRTDLRVKHYSQKTKEAYIYDLHSRFEQRAWGEKPFRLKFKRIIDMQLHAYLCSLTNDNVQYRQ